MQRSMKACSILGECFRVSTSRDFLQIFGYISYNPVRVGNKICQSLVFRERYWQKKQQRRHVGADRSSYALHARALRGKPPSPPSVPKERATPVRVWCGCKIATAERGSDPCLCVVWMSGRNGCALRRWEVTRNKEKSASCFGGLASICWGSLCKKPSMALSSSVDVPFSRAAATLGNKTSVLLCLRPTGQNFWTSGRENTVRVAGLACMLLRGRGQTWGQ